MGSGRPLRLLRLLALPRGRFIALIVFLLFAHHALLMAQAPTDLASSPASSPAASPIPAVAPPAGTAELAESLRVVVRHDLRRRIDGAYAGLFYGGHQGRWLVGPVDAQGRRSVRAEYWLIEEGRKDGSKAAQSVQAAMAGSFVIDAGGSPSDFQGDAVPLYRSWPPVLPPDIGAGGSWEAAAAIMVDPRGRGTWTEVPVLMRCTFVGRTVWQGKAVLEVRARYAIRLKAAANPERPDAPVSGSGSRETTIYLDPLTGRPLFAREKVSTETWTFADGTTMQEDGFILSFFIHGEGGEVRRERREWLEDAEDELKDVQGLDIVQDEGGTALTLRMLHFVADSPELLPGEDAALARIASLLSTLPKDRGFLVIGHTANVGSMESQDELSVRRAKAVVDALVKGGLEAERFLYRGVGGRESLGDDATEEGRALNRRVEIRILD